MDREEPGAPPAQDEFGQPGAVTRAVIGMAAAGRAAIAVYAHMAAALVAGYAYALMTGMRASWVPVYAGAPATTVASMPAGGGAARDPTTGMAYDANEPIRPRVHEIPHIDPDPGWNLPRPARLPHPTYWPAVLAMGIVILAWGLVTNAVVTVVGVVIFFVALMGWIGDMRHDS
jgi:hypothetical protein